MTLPLLPPPPLEVLSPEAALDGVDEILNTFGWALCTAFVSVEPKEIGEGAGALGAGAGAGATLAALLDAALDDAFDALVAIKKIKNY